MALSAAKLSVAVRVAARQTERKANCFCELYLFLNKECSLGPPLGQGQGSQDMPTRHLLLPGAVGCSNLLFANWNSCRHARATANPIGNAGHEAAPPSCQATGHGPHALMALLPSSSSWRFSIYYDFHILKNKYFIAALSKPAGD